ncbi:hypothetical protein D3C87_1904570 [compost metagenome]
MLLCFYLINQRIKLGKHCIGSDGRTRIVAAGRNGFTKFGSVQPIQQLLIGRVR